MRAYGSEPETTAMIGDRMDTDIVAGVESGMPTILVLIGVLSLIARLILDVVIAYTDPRIRYDQQPTAA